MTAAYCINNRSYTVTVSLLQSRLSRINALVVRIQNGIDSEYVSLRKLAHMLRKIGENIQKQYIIRDVKLYKTYSVTKQEASNNVQCIITTKQ